MIRRIAGIHTSAFATGDGGPALLANIQPKGIAIGPDGSVYFTDAFATVRRISPSGIITTIAGKGSSCVNELTDPTCAVGGPARQSRLRDLTRISVAPDGSLYFSQRSFSRVRRIAPLLPGYDGNAISIASADGAEVYQFDATGHHLRTIDALTKRPLFTFGYNSLGLLTTITDADSNISQLERNAQGDLTAVIGPFGQRNTVMLDARGFLSSITNPANEVTQFQHDTLGLLKHIIDPKGNPPHQFFYDSLGLIQRDQESDGAFKTLVRQSSDTSITAALTTALGRVTTYAVRFAADSSRLRSQTDPAGLSTFTVEGINGMTVVTSPDSTVASVIVKPDPRFGMHAPVVSEFSVRMPSGLQLAGTGTRKVTLGSPTDPLSLTSQTDSLVVNGRSSKSVFDAVARTLTQTSAEGRQTVTTLDTLGGVIEEHTAGVAPVRYGYGPRGLLATVTQAGRVLRYDYDSSGRVKKETDPLGRFEQYAYDSVGRVVKETLFNGREILHGYDASGNLTSLTPPGRPAHLFAYNAANLDSVYNTPPAGFPVSATKYTFDLDRQLTRIVWPDSLAIDITYDTAGRPSRLSLPNGQLQFAYSPTSGNLTALTAPDGGTLSYAYDGSLPKTVTWGGAIQGSVGFKYDSDFRVSKIAVNGTDSIAFGYDGDNLLTSAGAMTLGRDPQNGGLLRTVLATDTSTWTYDDSTGAVSRFTTKHGATTLFDVVYTRDSLDRIMQMIETVQGTSTTKAFTYDSVGRLDQVHINGILASDYGFDANGNRTSLTTQAGTVMGTYDDQDRMLTYGSGAYSYSPNGELSVKVIGSDTTRYSYDVSGNLYSVRLQSGATIDYLFDGQGRQIGKKVNGTLMRGWVYQGQLAPVAELDGNNLVVSRFVYGSRPNVPEYLTRTGVTYRLVTDHLGSVRLVVNTNTGAVVQRLDYDEYGRITQGLSNHLRYHGNHPTLPPFNALQKAWYGPPGWAKGAGFGGAGRAANAARDPICDCP